MTEFEPCPVTGCVPVVSWTSECSAGIEFKMCDPYLSGYELRTRWVRDSQFEDWYSRFYLPTARKYAEHLESQKPVEFQVGDVVGLSAEGHRDLCYPNSVNLCRESKVVRVISPEKVELSQQFVKGYGPYVEAKWLRLISRPAKLTVADLPEIEGMTWGCSGYPDPNSATTLFAGSIPQARFMGGEHKSVEAALDFLNKIWAAKPETKQ